MHLAFLVPGRLDQLTGGYLYDRHIVEGLRARGWRVDVVSLPGSHPVADGPTRAAATEALRGLAPGSTVVVDGLALPALADALRAPTRAGLRWIGLIHHPLSLETGLAPDDAHRFAQLEAELWPRLAGAICPSEHTARAVRASGLPEDRVAVVPPGTARPTGHDPAPASGADPAGSDRRRSPGPLRLLAVGSLTPRKGHRLLVEALAGLTDLDWRLTCLGSELRDPATSAALRDAIATHGLGDRVTLTGEQDDAALAQAYREADLFTLPSHHEGYGMVFAEALSHGLPIVATCAGALPDTVPVSAARLVPPGDVSALRAALREVMTNPDLRAQLGAGARRAAADLPTWDQAVGRWADAFMRLVR